MSDVTNKIETEQQPDELATKTEGELTEKDLASVVGGITETQNTGSQSAGAGKVTFNPFSVTGKG
jgi:bacteriocin-like protein